MLPRFRAPLRRLAPRLRGPAKNHLLRPSTRHSDTRQLILSCLVKRGNITAYCRVSCRVSGAQWKWKGSLADLCVECEPLVSAAKAKFAAFRVPPASAKAEFAASSASANGAAKAGARLPHRSRKGCRASFVCQTSAPSHTHSPLTLAVHARTTTPPSGKHTNQNALPRRHRRHRHRRVRVRRQEFAAHGTGTREMSPHFLLELPPRGTVGDPPSARTCRAHRRC